MTYCKIVNVGSHYNYSHEDHSEYLLIVSKEYGAHVNDNNANDEGSDKRKVKLTYTENYVIGFKFFGIFSMSLKVIIN